MEGNRVVAFLTTKSTDGNESKVAYKNPDVFGEGPMEDLAFKLSRAAHIPTPESRLVDQTGGEFKALLQQAKSSGNKSLVELTSKATVDQKDIPYGYTMEIIPNAKTLGSFEIKENKSIFFRKAYCCISNIRLKV